MSKLVSAITQHQDLSVEQQIKAGRPLGDAMPEAYVSYLKGLAELVDGKTISFDHPVSFVQNELYTQAGEALQGKVDLVLPSLADLVRHILTFYCDLKTPDACPQLKTMIDSLWQMLDRLGPAMNLLKLSPHPRMSPNVRKPEVQKAASEQVDSLAEVRSSLSSLADHVVVPAQTAVPDVTARSLPEATRLLRDQGRSPAEIAAYTLAHPPRQAAA